MKSSRLSCSLLAGVILLVAGTTQTLMAHVAVGNCKPGLTSFSTIQAAVTAAPAGVIVYVCPGTYPEQVVIGQPLTLQGVVNSGSAVIASPLTGIVANSVGLLAGQILVQNTAGYDSRHHRRRKQQRYRPLCRHIGRHLVRERVGLGGPGHNPPPDDPGKSGV